MPESSVSMARIAPWCSDSCGCDCINGDSRTAAFANCGGMNGSGKCELGDLQFTRQILVGVSKGVFYGWVRVDWTV